MVLTVLVGMLTPHKGEDGTGATRALWDYRIEF